MTTDTPKTPEPPEDRRRSHLAVYAAAAVVMVLASIPYLYGLNLQGTSDERGWYTGFSYNVSDSCVYMAWMRHAADGHFFEYNNFTTGEQYGKKFNVFFLLLGNAAGLTHLPLAVVYHIARIIIGVIFLRVVWWLLELTVADKRARWAAFFTVIFSSGLGWFIKAADLERYVVPNDLWQPEGFTFLCLYFSPFFVIALTLMLGTIGFLIKAERERSWRHAVYAGICALVLGNVHTYDIVPLALAWGTFLVARAVTRWRVSMDDLRSLGRGAIVGAMGSVSAGYQYYVLMTEPVFRSRVEVSTLSPPILFYLLGYGLTMALSAVAMAIALTWAIHCVVEARGRRLSARHVPPLPEGRISRADDWTPTRSWLGVGNHTALLLAAWIISNFIAAYLPVSFQRKMLMGVHVPMAILAGVALAFFFRRLRPVAWACAITACVAMLSLSNVWFLYNDMRDLKHNATDYNTVRNFMYGGEVDALTWLSAHTPAGTPIQPLPWVQAPRPGSKGFDRVDERGRNLMYYLQVSQRGLSLVAFPDGRGGQRACAVFDTTAACFAPSIASRPVNVGHIGESGTDYRSLCLNWGLFVMPYCTDAQRIDMLRASGVKYVIFSQKHNETDDPFTEHVLLSVFRGTPPAYLRRIPEASNADADVYQVVLPP